MKGALVIVSAAVGLLAIAACVNASDDCGLGTKTHNFYYGKRAYGDRLLYSDNLNYKSKWMRVQSVDVTYPSSGSTPQGTITYIEVLDQRSDGTGGCVYVKNGGVGSTSVSLHVKTQRNHGMDFIIRVYGR